MNHPRIDDDQIIDRYLAGRLASEDEEAFELHIFECASCLEQVQAGEDMRRGLQSVAAEDVAAQAAVSIGWLSWLRQRPAYLAAAAGLAMAFLIMPIALVRQQAELDRLLSGPGSGGLSEPIGGLAVISVGVERSAEPVTISGESSQQIRLLSLELPPDPAAAYDVTLNDADGKVLWSGKELHPSLYDTLLLALPSSYLPAGSYYLTIQESGISDSPASESPASRIELRVLAGNS